MIIKCNGLLRILQNKPRRCHVSELYSNFNTLPVNLLFNLFTMKLIYRCLYDSINVPVIIRNLFVRGNVIHSHNTRCNNNFILQNNINQKSISFYGPSIWNKLPTSLQTSPSINSFIKSYKEYLTSFI